MWKLLSIQTELKAPKDLKNNFGGYKYRSCESILEAVKPLLEKYKCTLTISDTLVNIWDRYYIKAEVTFQDNEDTTATAICTGYAREEEVKKWMDGSQITWASSSYARKYALNGLFLIDDAKDSDATNDGKPASVPAKAVELSDICKLLRTKIDATTNRGDLTVVSAEITTNKNQWLLSPEEIIALQTLYNNKYKTLSA